MTRGRVENLQTADGLPVAGAEPGNTRALVHGASSEQRLAPLREANARDLRADHPHLDGRRLAILADRLARLESARRWLDGQGGVVRDKRGEPWPIADRMEKWGATAERVLAQVEAESRAPVPVDERLREHLAARTEGART